MTYFSASSWSSNHYKRKSFHPWHTKTADSSYSLHMLDNEDHIQNSGWAEKDEASLSIQKNNQPIDRHGQFQHTPFHQVSC